ncbi:putative c2h2 type zinc finger containing protein [Rosellinia necatrix]|uniref:Putative c2h2 type zinc finger containing protein n=1 Tax=Rosellinia necatrix TaxID=77044 RepID=A0A1W2TRK3_ROSNE|nr:putative c2h2 type zinc finger containing protein [Rosellinia necatrix]
MRALLPPNPFFFFLFLRIEALTTRIVHNDFTSYPEGSWNCLYDSADSVGCNSASSGAELNQCLCPDRDFLYGAAKCIGRESPSDLNSVYRLLESRCAETGGIVLPVSIQDFLAAGSQTTSTLSQTTSTSTSTEPTSPPTSTESTGSPAAADPTSSPTATATDQPSTGSGLSTGAKIGVGVGIAFGAIAAALAAWFIWSYRKRQQPAQPVHGREISGGEPGTPYGGAGAPGMANGPQGGYVHDGTRQGALELSSSTFTTPAYEDGQYKKDTVAGVPLLAELRGPEVRQDATELPATPGYLGYHSYGGALNNPHLGREQGSGMPQGPSPASFSQGGMSDMSPFTPSRASENGTY